MADLATAPVARLFWEYAPADHATLPDEVVFARVMERGTLDDTRWLLRTFPADRLAAWFDARAGRHLSGRSLALWACLLKRLLPPSSIAVPWRHGD